MNLSAITLKKDPVLLAFAAFLVGVVGLLVYSGAVTWREAAGFLAGALALPGLLGAKELVVEDTSTTDPTIPPPPPTVPEVKQ